MNTSTSLETRFTKLFKPEQFVFSVGNRGETFVEKRTGWDDYLDTATALLTAELPKSESVGAIHAEFLDYTRSSDVKTIHALSIDIDKDLTDIDALLIKLEERLPNVKYLVQWRKTPDTYKVHIILPHSPFEVKDEKIVRFYRKQFYDWLLPEHNIDISLSGSKQYLFFYSQRPNEDPPQQKYYDGELTLDFSHFVMMNPSELTTTIVPKKGEYERVNVEPKPDERDPFVKVMLANQKHTWVSHKHGWEIECPVGHEQHSNRKTLLYPGGRVNCFAGCCSGKPQMWFIQHLEWDAQVEYANAQRISIFDSLRQSTERVSIDKAHEVMAKAISMTRPVESHATVIRVTTGAGKTHLISKYLNEYSAPFEDESVNSGLTSVLALPTNALLREVEPRIKIRHKRQTGILAVLNEDGSPACAKHEQAQRLQEAGGNVHRLMCAHCQFKETCTARTEAAVGDGALTLTNHSLLPRIAENLFTQGRHPLLVWDESPEWITTTTIPIKDLNWLIAEFDKEARPNPHANIFTRMADVHLFSDKYRVAIRPIIEAVRNLAQPKNAGRIFDVQSAVIDWFRLPLNDMLLQKAKSVCEIESRDAWTDLIQCFRAAHRLNHAEYGFDGLNPQQQARVLKAENIMHAVGVVAQANAMCVVSESTIHIAALTDNGELFKIRGGVVLDATANTAELRALRPDMNFVQVDVEDKGTSIRHVINTSDISRTRTKQDLRRVGLVIEHAKGMCRGLGKVVVFTYKGIIDDLQAMWPEATFAYFGNTRGYDHFFQDGYDAFITIGDPITNIGALALQWCVIAGEQPTDTDPIWKEYIANSARAELAQAHGRARDPQYKKGIGERLHVHYGKTVPLGWDQMNCIIDTQTDLLFTKKLKEAKV